MSSDYSRPDPDDLLRHLNGETAPRGKLKIFLGYAAGVGKTCAMLEAAQHRLAEGADVVAGYIEAHQRPETQALTFGLEMITRRQIDYRGVQLEEMDLDALLTRYPQIALVDELAHTNAPTSRHPKRYQDVEELLAAGIDVYSTLNIQHLESLNDVVAQITGVIVRETLPDRILEQADQIELIDLPPEELVERLKEGKVYLPEQAGQAVQKFFRLGNLTALREMALRKAAKRVDDQMTAYMQTRAITGPWVAGERLLVCISPSPLSQKLIRTGRRLAGELDAEWFAVYVETPGHADLSQSYQEQVRHNLQLARELGARVLTIPADKVVETIISYAHRQNITQIIVGKPLHPRWLELLRGSMVDELIRQSRNIDVYVISSLADEDNSPIPISFTPHTPWQNYLPVGALLALSTIFGMLIYEFVSPTNLVMFYLLCVVIAAVRLGRGPAIVTAILSVITFNFFFVPPRFTFAVAQAEYLLTFTALLVVGIVIAGLAARVREHAQAAQRRENATSALYAFSRDISTALQLNQIKEIILKHISTAFECEVGLFLPQHDTLQLADSTPNFPVSNEERAVAIWAFDHSQASGLGTDTLPSAKGRYLPLKSGQRTIGILGISLLDGRQLSPEQLSLLDAFTNQAALGLETILLAEQAQQAQLLQAKEKLQTALLNSISHDLRTPLVAITGALSSLRDQQLDEIAQTELIAGAWEESERLNRLVGNLLDMTRLEANAIILKKTACDVQELVGVALHHLQSRLHQRQIVVNLPSDLPPIQADFTLIVQVMTNLLDNALKYSTPTEAIEIQAQAQHNEVEIRVLDRGMGVAPENLTKIFDKFYRDSNGVSGTGLGLSISQGLVEIHGGRIWVEPRQGGGSIFKVTLPMAEVQI